MNLKDTVVVRSPLRDLPDLPRPSAELLRMPGMAQYHSALEQWWFKTRTVLLRDAEQVVVRQEDGS